MVINEKEYEEILITKDGDIIVSITDDSVTLKKTYKVTLISDYIDNEDWQVFDIK